MNRVTGLVLLLLISLIPVSEFTPLEKTARARDWECPPGAVFESEPCGEDYNGGCNMSIPAFEPLTPDVVVCGTAWADGSIRDTDWFEFTVTEDTIFTWTANAEFEVVCGIIEWYPGSEGAGDCSEITGGLSEYEIGSPLETVSVTSGCMPPGVYWFFIAQSQYSGAPCATGLINYWCELEVSSCAEPTATPGGPGELDECPETSIFSQPLTLDNGYMSDPDGPFYQAESFEDVTVPIVGLRWWGLETSTSSPNEFVVSFYPDAGGLPDPENPFWSGTVAPLKTDTGIEAFGLVEWVYDVNLPEPLAIDDGWLEIVAPGGDGASWYWSTGDGIDGSHANSTDQVSYTSYASDLAFCLLVEEVPPTTTPSPTPTPFESCPPGSIFNQLVQFPTEDWDAAASDVSLPGGPVVYENLYNFGGGLIQTLTWWGLDVEDSGSGWTEASKDSDFSLLFFEDYQGSLGLLIDIMTVHPMRTELSHFYDDLKLNRYEIDIGSSIYLPAAAWIGIQAETDPANPEVVFLWMSSGTGDGDSIQWDGSHNVNTGFDRSICAEGVPGTATPPPTETPHPTETPSPMPTYTAVPTATPTPVCPDLGVTLEMSDTTFAPGDMIWQKTWICWQDQSTGNIPFFCLLEAGGLYFFYPSWSMEIDYWIIPEIHPGLTLLSVIGPFTWPDTGSSGSAKFLAAITNPEITGVIGQIGIWEFSWGEN